jgi:hypothetical protein
MWRNEKRSSLGSLDTTSTYQTNSAIAQDSSQVSKLYTVTVDINLTHSTDRPLNPITAPPAMEKSEYEKIRDANVAE